MHVNRVVVNEFPGSGTDVEYHATLAIINIDIVEAILMAGERCSTYHSDDCTMEPISRRTKINHGR